MASDRSRGNTSINTVVIDSSAIMMLFEFSIDLENELTRLLGRYKIVVPKAVISELELLSEKGKGKKKSNAKPALKLANNYEMIDDEKKHADDAILNIAIKQNGIIFTNDKELKKRAKDKSIKVIFLRSKSKLEITY